MPTRQVDLETNIDGDPRGFNTASKSAAEHAKKLEREVAKLEARNKKLSASMAASSKSASLMRGELATLIGAGAAVSPAFITAGAGVAAFGALAVPAILGVVKAQTEMAETWDSLSKGQKISAGQARILVDRYKALAKAVEPEVLDAFNGALDLTAQLMPRLEPLTKATSQALVDFESKLSTALDSDEAEEFFDFLERQAGPGIDALGDVMMSGVHAASSLTQAWAPLATSGLGLVSMLADLVAGLAEVSPELAQLGILTVALRGPVGAVGDWFGKTSARAKALGSATKGASTATKLLNVVTSAGPNLYMAAGVALAFLGAKALSASSSTDKLVHSLTVANRATGNNLDGYRNLAAALQGQVNKALASQSGHYREVTKAVQENHGQVNASAIGQARAAYQAEQSAKKLTEAQKEVNTQYKNVISGADALARKYDLTREQAIRLADAVGVDLSKGILESGQITATVAEKFDRYRMAVELANNPTAVISQAWEDAANQALRMEQRVTALTAAVDAYFNPSLAVYTATTQMKQAFQAAEEAIKKSKTGLDGSKAAALAAQSAFAAAAQSVSQTAQATYTFTSRTKGAEAATIAAKDAVLAQLPELARLAGRNKDAQAQVAALAASYGISGREASAAGVKVQSLIKKINSIPRSASTTITANTGPAQGALNSLLSRINSSTASVRVGVMGGYSIPGMKRADGGPVRGPGGPRDDRVLIAASNGEYVVNARSTAKHRGLLEAINADRFADGGLVRGRGAVIRGYADGGEVTVAPLGEFLSEFMGRTVSKSTYTKAVNSRRDAVDQLRKAERKLADDRRRNKSARTIADDEARVAKERRDLAAATDRLKEVEAGYKKTKMSPVQQLSAALAFGIKNVEGFIRNITKLADMGFYDLAQSLLNMGGPDAEKIAAGAVKLSRSKLKTLNTQAQRAAKAQATLEDLPNILTVRKAQKSVGSSIPAIAKATGLSDDEVASAMGLERGGIVRYASGGMRVPGIATKPIVMFGEGRDKEAFIPYDRAYRRQAVGLVNQVASDLGMGGGGIARVVLDTRGGQTAFLRFMREVVRVEGRGDVQAAFGSRN